MKNAWVVAWVVASVVFGYSGILLLFCGVWAIPLVFHVLLFWHCSVVQQVFCILLFCVPVFLVLQYATGEVLILNADLAIAKSCHVSTQLSEKIDDQEQYSRRLYLVFEGLNSVDDDNKNLSQEVVNIVRN